jgi:hemerythrin-like domain-containing protein
MLSLLNRLNQDHKHLAHLLDLLDRELDQFHEGREPEFDLVCEMLEYIESYADGVHNPTEELIFDVLEGRTGEKADVIERLRNEHESVKILSLKFRQALDGIIHEAVMRRDEVEVRGRALVKLEREHLDLEEEQVFPLARKLLTDADWAAIAQAAPKPDDPVFGVRDPSRFRILYQHLVHMLEG